MKGFVTLMVPVLLASCGSGGDPQIERCEAAIQARLKAPSSYKRISSDGMYIPRPDGKGEGSYTIAFDAVNSYNAPIRDEARCFITDDKVSVYLSSELRPD